tara:strand:- start:290 stop:493 length:204 start_codon:yes stop_codon:yes gene_type:complete
MDNIDMKDYITQELATLDRSIVATPRTREDLELMAKTNNGSSDILLMQMAMQYGYKLALENLEMELS